MNNFHKHLSFALLLLLGSSCSSSHKAQRRDEDFKEVIVSRSDELSERPIWAKESEEYSLNDGSQYQLGMTIINADQQIDSAYKIAENSAKVSIIKSIEQKVEYFLQTAKEGLEINDNQLRYVSTEVSKASVHGIQTAGRYWEKFVTSDDFGTKKSRYRVFVKIKIADGLLQEQLASAIAKTRGKQHQSEDFKKEVSKKWSELFSKDNEKNKNESSEKEDNENEES